MLTDVGLIPPMSSVAQDNQIPKVLVCLLVPKALLICFMVNSQKEVGSPEPERGAVNSALYLYDVIQLDFIVAI